MPTYQYACTDASCGHQFEAVQSFTDDPLTVCPRCEGRLRKVFSAVGVVFKGSGFYRTDSRSTGAAKETKGADAGGGSDGTAPASPAKQEAGPGGAPAKTAPAGSSSPGPAAGTSSGSSSSGSSTSTAA